MQLLANVLFGLGSGLVFAVGEAFGLLGGEERLGCGVVQRRAYSFHGLDDPQAFAGFHEGVGGVLGTAGSVWKITPFHVSAAGGHGYVDGGLGEPGGGIGVAESETENTNGSTGPRPWPGRQGACWVGTCLKSPHHF